jgi:alpha-tubulin suppressor-like RCC1 family protein
MVDGLELDFGAEDVVQLSLGASHGCALFASGAVRCWGASDRPPSETQAILGTDVVSRVQGFVDPLTTGNVRLPGRALQISAAPGGSHTCALLAGGEVACWGLNASGQLGSGDRAARGGASELPVVALPVAALEVRAGSAHSCALLSDEGRVSCWGSGAFGRLGYGNQEDRLAPLTDVAVGGPARQLATGVDHTCALLTTGAVRCWGANDYGQLGYGHELPIGDDETPVGAAAAILMASGGQPVGGDLSLGGQNVVQIVPVVDQHATCARFANGTVRCWGQNDGGDLGYGHTVNQGTEDSPARLATLSVPDGGGMLGGDLQFGAPGVVSSLADGGRCARLEGGAVYCWGRNQHGQLGLPDSDPEHQKPNQMGPVIWER